jgi:sterol desaturase/sphingolipid hydroxylase (fatty acid hydroxylase superfamily)
MGDAFVALAPWQVVLYGTVWFSALYFGAGSLTWWLTQHLLPHLRYGRVLDPRPLPRGQLRREIGESVGAILVFGFGLLAPWGMLQLGWARLAHDPSLMRIAVETLVLFFWNELHFYANHRLLHTKLLRRFHGDHHRSHTATPFSTYALHPLEALMLGSVPLLPMLVHDFSLQALAALTILSIVLNNLGHSNYEFSATAPARGWRAASRRHHLHHACYHGNYGFLLDVFDRWAGSALPLDAGDARLASHKATSA